MTTLGLIVGSLPLSRTQRHVARLLAEVAPRGTRVVELIPRGLPDHAPYSDVPAPSGALAWHRSVASVDGLVVLTPTVERSIPGSLKHAIDWAGSTTGPSAWVGTPTVIAGVSVGNLPRFAPIQHLRSVLTEKGAALRSQPETVLFAAPESFSPTGEALDPDLVDEARALISAAAGITAHQRRAGAVSLASASTEVDPVAAIAAAGPAPASPQTGIPMAPPAA